MINQVMLIGRVLNIKNDVILIASKKNKDLIEKDGFEEDIIPIYVYGQMSSQINEYLKIGDLLGVKGRLQKRDGHKGIKVIADKLTFLTTKTEGVENE